MVRRGRWQGHWDWAGWSLGYYPTNEDPRSVVLQNIKWYCSNFDVCWSTSQDWRIQWMRHPIPYSGDIGRRGLHFMNLGGRLSRRGTGRPHP